MVGRLARGRDDVSMVLAGEAGQGIQTVEYILTRVLKLSGYNVFSSTEFMSRIRGGTNSTEIRISPRRVSSFVDRIDILIPLSKGALQHVGERVSPETIVLGEKENFQRRYGGSKDKMIDVPFSQIASDVGSKVYSNIVAVGVLSGVFDVEMNLLSSYLRKHFSRKGEEVVQKNVEAATKGYAIGSDLAASSKIDIEIEKNSKVKDEILLNGAEAVALGAIGGGCNFVSFYPMSPSTPVAVFLAQHCQEFDIIVEQVEDEISAINMAVGTWYGGGRAMVTTSGGGFALMVEGLSLAGMLEIPVVIHLGQRPAPATGLPTRTEQADLLFTLHAGHGEFPRIILAPGTLADVFYLTQKAFNLADKYQVPVILLTDQYLLDSYYNVSSLETSLLHIERHIVNTGKDYRRYEVTGDGISPRGIPGFGEGLVVVDSDEHDEEGHITEDLNVRTKMVNKRLKKLDLVKREAFPPELIGPENYKTLMVGWGSTYHVVREAIEQLGREDISFLHFKQVYPLHHLASDYLKRAEHRVIIENNATSQFGTLVELLTHIDFEKKILKYDGLPFSLEEVVENMKTL